jgi:hypothetical protein
VIDDELVITVGPRRRFLKLPRRMARSRVRRAKLEGGLLRVRFDSNDAAEGDA